MRRDKAGLILDWATVIFGTLTLFLGTLLLERHLDKSQSYLAKRINDRFVASLPIRGPAD
jgi:hypothetical protein